MVFVRLFRKLLFGRNRQGVIAATVLLCSAAVASADGSYQRTKDGKTLVWNEHPKPGDVATWSGRRDSDDYATGFGTLTWYRSKETIRAEPKQTLYAYFFGNMVRGKFDGPVNGHWRGLTNHAIFDKGRRASQWAAGSVPSWTMPRSARESVTPEENEKPEIVQQKPQPEVPRAKSQNVELAELNPAPKSRGAAASRPLPSYNAIKEEPKAEATAEGPPPLESKSNAATSSSGPAPKVEIDDSLRALTGPPPELGAAENGGMEPQKNFGSSKHNHMRKDQVLELSDAEARKRGYDLTRYERPDPQFDPVDNTWSLSYVGKTAAGGKPATKYFTVAVDDKTKRTAIVPGR